MTINLRWWPSRFKKKLCISPANQFSFLVRPSAASIIWENKFEGEKKAKIIRNLQVMRTLCTGNSNVDNPRSIFWFFIYVLVYIDPYTLEAPPPSLRLFIFSFVLEVFSPFSRSHFSTDSTETSSKTRIWKYITLKLVETLCSFINNIVVLS